MIKLIYMPFDPSLPINMSAVFEYGSSMKGSMAKNQAVIDHELSKGHQALDVWYNGKKNHFLAGMTDGQIYIRGHGMSGFKSIEGGRGGERIDYDEVAKRLIKSGLKKHFRGKIKLFNCHSAEATSEENKGDTEYVGEAFAQLVADEMYSKGYKNCTYYGYIGPVDSMPKDGSQGKHKYRRETQFKDGKMQQVEMGRASENRVQFQPRPVPKKKKHCYLATAACRAMYLSEDCDILNSLRRFRDGYVITTPHGRRRVREYYEIGPELVQRIDARADAVEIYREIFFKWIEPAAAAIEGCNYEVAEAIFYQVLDHSQKEFLAHN